MADAGGPGSVRKCPEVALADLGDTEGFDKNGKENQLYVFQLSDGVYKRKKVTQEGIGLCSYIPGTKNLVISESYMLTTNNDR